jgi:hypothetical protein
MFGRGQRYGVLAGVGVKGSSAQMLRIRVPAKTLDERTRAIWSPSSMGRLDKHQARVRNSVT